MTSFPHLFTPRHPLRISPMKTTLSSVPFSQQHLSLSLSLSLLES
ncbi:hypothetical protein OAV88_01230 [bacterium]|nr:hypothetical protein [bacterium]